PHEGGQSSYAVRGLLFHLPTCGNRACGCAALPEGNSRNVEDVQEAFDPYCSFHVHYPASTSGPVSNSLPLRLFQLNDSNAIFIDHNCDGSHARTSHSRTGNFASRSFMRCDAQSI